GDTGACCPVLALYEQHGMWKLTGAGGCSYTTPAYRGDWTHVVMDATYSDSSAGRAQISVTPQNHPGASSPTMQCRTVAGDPSGPIPSALVIGPYHDTSSPAYYTDFAKVRVMAGS